MTLEKQREFIEWLDEMIATRNWSDNQLAKEAGISHSVISKARSGVLPKWDACEAISAALNVSPVLVFRKAGLLPPGPSDEVAFEDWKYILDQLDPRDQEVLKKTALNMLESDKKD